jgi:hypothetical protein
LGGCDTRSGAHSKVCSLIDGFPDLDEVEENGRIDRVRAGSYVIAVGERFEDFGW